MRKHLCCADIHLLSEKSLSLTSLANTRARCSIQTTRCYSVLKKQQISHSSSTMQNSPAAVFEDGSLAAPVSFEQLVRWTRMIGGLHHCTSLCWSGCAGFQVLAELLPEGRQWKQIPSLPPAASILEMELSFDGMEITLMKNTFLHSFIIHKVNAHEIETFSPDAGRPFHDCDQRMNTT